VRTIVEVETADGYVGLGEMGGGGEDAARQFSALLDYLRGHDVFRLEALRFAICNPTASLYNNRTQLHAAIEFACLDIMGQKLGMPVHALLGGKLRTPGVISSFATTTKPARRSAHGVSSSRRALKAQHGFACTRAASTRRARMPPRGSLTAIDSPEQRAVACDAVFRRAF
jgi:glucarate dehydratase